MWEIINLLILLILSPDESRGYIGFMSVAPPPHILTCVRNNSKTFPGISFKLGPHVFRSGEDPYFKVTLNSQ